MFSAKITDETQNKNNVNKQNNAHNRQNEDEELSLYIETNNNNGTTDNGLLMHKIYCIFLIVFIFAWLSVNAITTKNITIIMSWAIFMIFICLCLCYFKCFIFL